MCSGVLLLARVVMASVRSNNLKGEMKMKSIYLLMVMLKIQFKNI
jgi:hypothetical protein